MNVAQDQVSQVGSGGNALYSESRTISAQLACSCRVVTLAETMLKLNKQRHSAKLAPSRLEPVGREIATTDEEIDDLVYKLYGIAHEEQKIVEGG